MYADNYSLNMTGYLKRKQNFESRVQAMINYINNTNICRSNLIAGYFTGSQISNCGICDNCINQKALQLTPEEFDQIRVKISESLHKMPLSVENLLTACKSYKKEKVWKVLDYLQGEQQVMFNNEGMISIV